MENLALHAPAGETCVGLVVDGGALAVMLHPEHQDGFVQLCSACRSVVCCRVSPMQKVGGGGRGGQRMLGGCEGQRTPASWGCQ